MTTLTRIGSIQQATTTGPLEGISGVAPAPASHTPTVNVYALTTSNGTLPRATITIEHSTDGIIWLPVCEFTFEGQIISPVISAIQTTHLNSHVRPNLTAIGGTISYTALI